MSIVINNVNLTNTISRRGITALASVRIATTVNGTLATDYENGDTVDGQPLVTGDRILIKNQTTASENGIYEVQVSGAPLRTIDFSIGDNAAGKVIRVKEGTANVTTGWVCTNNVSADVIGTDNLVFNTSNSIVKGPGSSTDNAVARWHSTGGTDIQNSGCILNDNDDMSGLTTMQTLSNPVGTPTHIYLKIDDGAPGADTYSLNWNTSSNGYSLTTTEDGTYRYAHLLIGNAANTTNSFWGISYSTNSGSSWNPLMVANAGGNIGIAKNNPASPLDITGNIGVNTSVLFDETTNDLTVNANDQPSGAATATLPDLGGTNGDIVITNTSQTLTNKTITATSNTVHATHIRTATGAVNVSSATAPTSGQVLKATGATAATWQSLNGLPNIFMGYCTASTDISSGFTDIPWSVELRDDSDFTHAASSAEVTINTSGDYYVIADINVWEEDGTDSTMMARIVQDTGSGYAEVTGSRTYFAAGNYFYCGVRITRLLTSVTATDKIKIQATISTGTTTASLYNNCKLFIERKLT